MPFYVDYSIKRRTIAIRGVNPIQFIICDLTGTIINLAVTLNDYENHRNVSFEWVQIKGNPVVLSSTNTLSTSYEFYDTTDKTFRFYIDKDTARETYIDVKVYYTPTSFLGMTAIWRDRTILPIITVNVLSLTAIIDSTLPATPECSPTEAAEELGLTYTIFPEVLPYVDQIDVLYSPIEEVYPSTPLETWVPPFPATYLAAPGYYVFIFSVTYPSGVQDTFYSDIYVSKAPAEGITSKYYIASEDVNLRVTRKTISITRSKNIKREYEESFIITAVVNNNIKKYLNKVLFEAGEPEISIPLNIRYNMKTVSITKSNPSGVGS